MRTMLQSDRNIQQQHDRANRGVTQPFIKSKNHLCATLCTHAETLLRVHGQLASHTSLQERAHPVHKASHLLHLHPIMRVPYRSSQKTLQGAGANRQPYNSLRKRPWTVPALKHANNIQQPFSRASSRPGALLVGQ